MSTSLFDLVSGNLAKIGALSVDQYLSGVLDDQQVLDLQEAEPTPTGAADFTPTTAFSKSTPGNAPNLNTENKLTPLARLHQECQRRFGSTEALKFEYIEEDGANSKRCILTITRPNGATRCYTTQPVFHRKNEAKAHVASIAMDMGAIEFILTGDQGRYKGKLAPLDGPILSKANAVATQQPNSKDASIIEIEECCRQWRAGLVKPQWVALHDRKLGNKHGTALRIRLSPHSFKVYSTGLAFSNAFEAKRACAKLAIAQGVLDFVKFGNGQTQPAVVRDDHESELARIEANADPSVASVLSLQEFYESLPRPFPEPVGDKTATEINPPAWLNVTIQSARGGKLTTNFIWTSDNRNGSLYGCLLRLEHSGEPTKSYLVDARFSKRSDAKAAVCLQAMSEGIGDYIRAISATIESKVTPEMRNYVTERIYPLLASEYAKIRPGTHPSYEYQKDKDAFGCTMKILLSSAPAIDDVRRFIVPAEYRTKADAKTAVTLAAVEQGVVELLRFRGDPPPPNYVPFKIPPNYSKEANEEPVSKKRREPDSTGEKEAPVQSRKKRKMNAQQRNRQGDVSPIHPDDEDSHPPKSNPPGGSHGGSTTHGRDNRSWKKPHVPSSGGLESLSETVNTGLPTDQPHSGSRYESGSTLSSRDRHPAHGQAPSRWPLLGHHPSTSSALVYNANHGHGGGQASHHSYQPPPAPFHSGVYSAQQNQRQGLGYGAGDSSASASSAQPLSYLADSGTIMPAFGVGHMQPRDNFPDGRLAAQYLSASSVPGVVGFHHQPTTSAGYRAHNDRQQDNTYSHRAPIAALVDGASSSQVPYGSYDPPGGWEISEQSRVDVENEHDKNPYDTTTMESSRRKGKKHQAAIAGPSQGKKATPEQGNGSSLVNGNNNSSQVGDSTTTKSSSAGNPSPNAPPAQASTTAAKRSHVQALLDYCDERGTPRPQYHHEILSEPVDKPHKVWVIMGSEKLELPVTFSTLAEGQDRVAKQILNRLRSLANKGKGKEVSR